MGGGTNQNEAFHRYINSFFHKSRIGILLAYALMMTIICRFNRKDDYTSRRKLVKPVTALSPTIREKEPMGLPVKCTTNDYTWQQEQQEGMFETMQLMDITDQAFSQFKLSKLFTAYCKTAVQVWKYMRSMLK